MYTKFVRKLSQTVPSNVPELLDKFKGCLLGGLIGDCYGKPYKLDDDISNLQLQKYFDKLDGPYFKSPYKPYSSSTALAHCLGESLISEGRFNTNDVAKRFVKTYFECPNRDYGANIAQILIKLRGSKFADTFGPARQQYFGLGSFGNKAAARIAPVTLYYYNDPEEMIKVATQSAELTHTNKLGRDGALLQSWAIRLALDINNFSNPNQFLEALKQKVELFECDEEEMQLKDAHRYKEQLSIVQRLLTKSEATADDVVNTLGHAKVAVFSIPTAIYCFLRGCSDIPGVETSNRFRRTIQYAISLGGDADAIAGMAGALAGACYGYNSISKSLLMHCEGASYTVELAEILFNNAFSN